MDYNQTLNLPKTDFPMRASLPQREPEFLKKWYENDQYQQLMKHNDGKPLFVLHPKVPFPGSSPLLLKEHWCIFQFLYNYSPGVFWPSP